MNLRSLLLPFVILYTSFGILSAAPPPELTVLQQQYEKAVTAPHEAAVTDLNTKFTAALGNAITAAKQAGKLEEVLAIQDDEKRLANKLPLPDDDEKTPEGLKKLRAIYRDQLSKLEAQRTANHTTLLPAYTAKLKELEANLTKIDRIEEAKEVMKYREGLAADAPPPTLPMAGAKPSTATTPIAEVEAKREHRPVIEWILKVGGTAEVFGGGTRKWLKPGDVIPKGKLALVSISLSNYTGKIDAPITDADLEQLSGIETLESVNINKVTVNAAGMKFLSSCPNVSHLALHDSPVDTAQLAPHLARLTNLKKLDINGGGLKGWNMSREFLAAAAELKLEELGIRGCGTTDDAFEPVSRIKSLTKLFIGHDPGVTDGIIPHLLPLKNLISLHLGNTMVSDEGICQLASPRVLNLSWGSSKGDVTASSYTKIAKAFPSLEYLGLPRDRAFTAEEMEWLASALPDLKRVAMDYGKPQSGSLKPLSRIPKLETLTLWKCVLTDDQMVELVECKKLRKLEINDTNIGDAGLEHLRAIKSLNEINIGGTAITDAGRAAFKKARPDVNLN